MQDLFVMASLKQVQSRYCVVNLKYRWVTLCLAACWEVLSQKRSDGAPSARRVRRNKDTSSVGYICFSSSLSLFLSSEDGWHASSDASSGSLTYFRKYHRFLLIALLSSRPLRTSPTGPTNSLITSSPRSPFSHAHVVASLFNTKIKTTTIFNNAQDCGRDEAIWERFWRTSSTTSTLTSACDATEKRQLRKVAILTS